MMNKISDVIKILEKVLEEHGDLEVLCHEIGARYGSVRDKPIIKEWVKSIGCGIDSNGEGFRWEGEKCLRLILNLSKADEDRKREYNSGDARRILIAKYGINHPEVIIIPKVIDYLYPYLDEW